MNILKKASCLSVLLAPFPAAAADFYGQGGYYQPAPRAVVIERSPVEIRSETVLQRRVVVAPTPRPSRVIEQRTVEGPGGVTRTTRIYEHYGHAPTHVLAPPRPPRNIPLVSHPYSGRPAHLRAAPIMVPSMVAPEVDGDWDGDEFE